MIPMNRKTEGMVVLYQTGDGKVAVNVRFEDETFWLTQKAIAELFDVGVPAITKHLKNIYDEEELDRDATTSKMEIVQHEGNRQVTRTVEFYNLDAIIAVGYRVNSKKATKFRQWATQTLREYIQKGFVLNDDLLKNGSAFGRDYFDELPLKEIDAIEVIGNTNGDGHISDRFSVIFSRLLFLELFQIDVRNTLRHLN